MDKEKETKDKFHKRITVILTFVCIAIITVVGTIMLEMETKSTVIVEKHDNSKDIEATIDEINNSETSQTKYSPDVHGLININTASKETLMLLDGIGETRAEAIISYRTQKVFSSVSEIFEI